MATQAVAQIGDAEIIQLIVFHVGEEEFGVPIGEVREIIKAGTVTPVPDSPAFVGGLINVRGDIVVTIDLRARFAMPVRKVTEPKHTVITRQGDNLFGLMVDEVTEVLRIPETAIKKAPDVVTHQGDDYVKGVLPLDNRLIILLDLGCVLSDQELARLTEIGRRAHEHFDSGDPGVSCADPEERQLLAEEGVGGAH